MMLTGQALRERLMAGNDDAAADRLAASGKPLQRTL
jgi:hypothetical protein